MLTTLRVFFTVDDPCTTSAGTCATIESVSEDGEFNDTLSYEPGQAGSGPFDQNQQTVVAYVDIVSSPDAVPQFGTVYPDLLGDFVNEADLAALLLGATRQWVGPGLP